MGQPGGTALQRGGEEAEVAGARETEAGGQGTGKEEMKWRKATLGEVVSLQRGYDLPEQDRRPGSFPIVGSAGPNGSHDKANVSGPGVVIGRSGAGFGSAHYCTGDFWALNTGLFVSDFRGNDPKFVFYLLDYLDFTKYNSGGAQPSLNRNFIYPISVQLPPQREQTQIAGVLFYWDTAIEITERLIVTKEKQYVALVQKLISRQCARATGRWPVKHLGDVFSERVEANRAGLPLLSITREEGIIPHGDSGRKDNSNEDKSKYLRVCPGDIAYNTMRMWQGVSSLSKYEGIVSPAYTVCVPSKELFGDFVAHYFKSPWMIHQFYRYSQGLTSDTWNLKFKHFREIKASIPSLDEQIKIAKVLNAPRAEMELLKKQAEYFRTQKRGLMQKLLTGVWRVNTKNLEGAA